MGYTAGMARWLLLILLVAFSSGWVLPLFLSVKFLLDWCRLEASPMIYEHAREMNAFPFLTTSERLWCLTSVWLAIVAVFWSAVAAQRWLFPK